MTRYLLTPKNLDLDQYDVASLIPTDGFKGENIEVELPKEILPIFNTPGGDMNRDNHYNMINKLAKCDIGRSKDGILLHENKSLDVSFDDFLCDICKKHFSPHYEIIYCILRKKGIIF